MANNEEGRRVEILRPGSPRFRYEQSRGDLNRLRKNLAAKKRDLVTLDVFAVSAIVLILSTTYFLIWFWCVLVHIGLHWSTTAYMPHTWIHLAEVAVAFKMSSWALNFCDRKMKEITNGPSNH